MRNPVSKVWQIHGFFGKVTAGFLIKENDRIKFITDEGVLFDVPLSSLQQIKWPWLSMGLGFDTNVNGKTYKLSFAKPNAAAPEHDGNLLDQILGLTDAGRLSEAYKS